MKTCFFTLLLTSAPLFASDLVCVSAPDQILYYSDGVVRIQADIADARLLSRFSLSTTGSSTMGVDQDKVSGVVRGGYVRFATADAWCGYNLALPESFTNPGRFTGFVDAYCEGGSRSSFRVSCRTK